MEELKSLVPRARCGDLDAYGEIVRRFQDMAYGYAYSILGDFHLAEDAAQEAFIDAYRLLPTLREPAAFPGWFRTIVFKHCDRIRRRRGMATAPLTPSALPASSEPTPVEAAERHEMQHAILEAIRALPDCERTVTTLFYIDGYSQRDIAEFLELPLTTVNSRLHLSRKRLKERMVAMVSDEFKKHPVSPEFPERIRLLLELPRPLQIAGHPVWQLWEAFRTCFPHFELVQLDEVCRIAESRLKPETISAKVYQIDEQRILRPELTSQLIERWLSGGARPVRWIAVGRIFRKEQSTTTSLEVHHQAEMFWCGEEATQVNGVEAIRRVAAKLLPGLEVRGERPCSYAPVGEGRWYEALWRGQWLSVAAGGPFNADWLRQCGVDPERCHGFGFAFGLERCAQVRLDLEDVRALWQPPYVPARKP